MSEEKKTHPEHKYSVTIDSTDRLPTQRLSIFQDNHFWLTNPRIFVNAPLVPKNTNFEGGTRAEKTQFFWFKFSQLP